MSSGLRLLLEQAIASWDFAAAVPLQTTFMPDISLKDVVCPSLASRKLTPLVQSHTATIFRWKSKHAHEIVEKSLDK